jgi:peptide deformylase
MSIIQVKKMGEKSLLEASLPVENFSSKELYNLIEDMKDTMKQEDGVGIAAPQIGCNQRVIIFGFELCERYPNEAPIPFTVLINPEIEFLSNEIEDGWEACLSVPGLMGLVPRYTHIKYMGFNEKGEYFSRFARGFHARIVQHETDHLNGILYPQRIKDLRFFGYRETQLNKPNN